MSDLSINSSDNTLLIRANVMMEIHEINYQLKNIFKS